MIAPDDFLALAREHGTWPEALAANPDVTAGMLPLLDDPDFDPHYKAAIFEIWMAQSLGLTVNLVIDG